MGGSGSVLDDGRAGGGVVDDGRRCWTSWPDLNKIRIGGLEPSVTEKFRPTNILSSASFAISYSLS